MKLVILDRDGVINQDSDYYIKSPDEWIPIPGSIEAIARLTQGGYCVVVITNQSGIGRKLFDIETLNAMHEKMYGLVETAGGRIDALLYCPHTPKSGCDCRKPKTGLFEEVADRLGIKLKNVPAIGDSLRDLTAAAAVNARPILVKTGKGKRTLSSEDPILDQIDICENLSSAVEMLLTEYNC